jgi:hypothetical protein
MIFKGIFGIAVGLFSLSLFGLIFGSIFDTALVRFSLTSLERRGWDLDDDDVYFKKITTRDVPKSDPTQKCRPAKGISKRVNVQIIP